MKTLLARLFLFFNLLLPLCAQAQTTPSLLWATYFGTGDSLTWGEAIARDTSGNIYITGYTYSYTGLATSSAFLTAGDSIEGDAFLAKFSPSGNLIWGTYFGGDDYDGAFGVATDKYGNVYISGITYSGSGIATKGAYRTLSDSVIGDGFLAKFSSNGNLLWGTYYGGRGNGFGAYVATDDSGNIYMSGATFSPSGIATKGAYQATGDSLSGSAFLAKFNSSGNLIWGTYYADSGTNTFSIATYAANIYITGQTTSESDIATSGVYQTQAYMHGSTFLADFKANGSLDWATYYGGYDDGEGVEVDPSGNIFITGEVVDTASGIVTSGAYQTFFDGGGGDAFLAKFSSSGNLIWGTYFGGDGDDIGISLAFDQSGNVYMAGGTSSISGISTYGAYQTSYGGGVADGFISKFTNNGGLLWATYYGGKGWDDISGITTDASGNNLYVTGMTDGSSGVATSNAYQDSLSGQWNAFLAKFQIKTYQNDAGVYSIFSPKKNVCPDSMPVKVQLKNYGSNALQSAIINWKINGIIQTTYKWTGNLSPETTATVDLGSYTFSVGTYTITAWASLLNGDTDPVPGNDTEQITVIVYPVPKAIAGKDTLTCPGGSIIIGHTPDLANTYLWTSKPIGYISTSSSPNVSPYTTTTYYLTEIKPGGCSNHDSVIITTKTLPPAPAISLSGDTFTSSAKTTNQWLLNDTLIKGATGQEYIATTDGDYSVMVTDTDGCSNVSTFIHYTVTGVNQFAYRLNFKIYPNPSPNTFIISLDTKQENAEIALYDVMGKKLAGFAINDFQTFTVNASDYGMKSGVYILSVRAGNSIYIGKLVVE